MPAKLSYPVLYVEDDDNDRMLLEMACTEAGVPFSLQIARDGAEAISYLNGDGDYADRARFPFPQLLLLDLKLPRKSGFEVLEWVRDQSQMNDLPIIVLSSSDRETDAKKAFDHGAIYYFVKPLSLQRLVEMVKEIQHKWLAQEAQK
jgi:DNA-binding response OmpR family regulator